MVWGESLWSDVCVGRLASRTVVSRERLPTEVRLKEEKGDAAEQVATFLF